MVAFTEGTLVLGALLGAGMRLRIFLDSPLRSTQPLLWALEGFVQDVSIYSLAGAITLVSTRYVWQRRSWDALNAFVLTVCFLHLIWSEVVGFFGHAVRARDLQVGLRPVLFLHSIKLDILGTLIVVLLVTWTLVRWTARRARRTGGTWATAPRLLALGVLAGALAAVPISIHQAETARNPIVAIASLARNWPSTDAEGRYLVPAPSLPAESIREIAGTSRDFSSAEFPLAYRPSTRSAGAPRLPAGVKPNLVFIVMEGVRSEEIGAYGGKIAGLTPNLDELARRGIRVDRFYSNGNHTPEGELALWYGLLPSPYEVMLTTRSEIPMTGLPEFLQRAGWKSFLWIHNGDQNFYRRDRFYLPRGFRTIDGQDFPKSEPRTNWGFSDRALARRTVAALDATAGPFAAMMLTVSNHHPFQLPSDAQTRLDGLPAEQRGFIPFGKELVIGMHTVPMLRTLHYTDEAVGYFFDLARTRPWFANTVFVITGDHGLPIAPLDGLRTFHRFIELRHRVPLIIYSPLLAGGVVIPGPGSQVDVMPTLLGLFGIPGDRVGLGRDLLDADSDDPSRAVVLWTRDAQTVTVVTQNRVYHRRLNSREPLRFGNAMERLLIDPRADPEGEHDLSRAEAATALRLARAGQEYFEVYPWMVVQGRSGLPSLGAKHGIGSAME